MDNTDFYYVWRVMIGRKQDRLIFLIIFITILTVAPVGYHVIALNVPAKTIQHSINHEFEAQFGSAISTAAMDILWSFIVACQSIGAFVSCFVVVPLQRRYGTMYCLIFVNNYVLFAGSLAFLLSSLYINIVFTLVLGRLLIGFYTGIGCALVPLFIHELAPAKIKGSLSCFLHIAVCVGSSLGAFLSLEPLLGGSSTWNYLLALPFLVGVAQMVYGRFYVGVNSPSYFLTLNDREAAAASIRFIYSLDDDVSDEAAIHEYRELISALPDQLSVRDGWSRADVRRGIWLGGVVSAAQIFSGSMATVSYSTSMLDTVSFNAWWTSLMPTVGSLISVFLTLPALRLVETCGRKELFINTLVACTAANLLLSLFSIMSSVLGESAGSWPAVAFSLSFLVYGVAYNVGVGPVGYFLPSELVRPEAAGLAMGCAVAINWLATMLTTLVYYPLNELIGGWSFFLFIVPSTFFVHYLNKELPNADDPTAEEEAFMRKGKSLSTNDPSGGRSAVDYRTFESHIISDGYFIY